ncbi:hypothetical protein [Helicobacter sp.]|uniref:hypothetical protein n=1 Tax=Helicobacter sp. TaxID=218 RepID=UPI0025B9BF67|nr:hypothetical protein [Helicobacter sp.]MCI5967955.1 hypothetical protein [Helicobacter sp.]
MYYVYPSGWTGKLLAAMVEYVDGVCPKLVDDAVFGSGLLDYKEEILKTHSIVLLAWDKKSGWNDSTMQQLVMKLQKFGIPYEENAMEQYALKVVEKLKANVLSKGIRRCVGIELGGMAEDKHIGLLDDLLVEIFGKNVLILYFCGFIESYKRILRKIKNNNIPALAVCLSPYDLAMVDFVDVLCKVSWTLKNPSVKTIEIGHSMSDFSKMDLDQYEEYFDDLCIASSDFYPKTKPQMITCLKSGYLAFDRTCAELVGLGSGGGGGIV